MFVDKTTLNTWNVSVNGGLASLLVRYQVSCAKATSAFLQGFFLHLDGELTIRTSSPQPAINRPSRTRINFILFLLFLSGVRDRKCLGAAVQLLPYPACTARR